MLRQGSHSDVVLTAKPGQGLLGNPVGEIQALNRAIADRRARGGTRADAEDLFQKRNALVASHDVHFSPRITQSILAGVFSPERHTRPGHARFKLGPLSGQLGLKGVRDALCHLVDTATTATAGGTSPDALKFPAWRQRTFFSADKPQVFHQHGTSLSISKVAPPLALWYMGCPLPSTHAYDVPAVIAEHDLKRTSPGYKAQCTVKADEWAGEIALPPVLIERGQTSSPCQTTSELALPLAPLKRFLGRRPINMAYVLADDTTFHGTIPYAFSRLPVALTADEIKQRQKVNTIFASELGERIPEGPYQRILFTLEAGRERVKKPAE